MSGGVLHYMALAISCGNAEGKADKPICQESVTLCERMASDSSVLTIMPAPQVDGPPTNSIRRAAQNTPISAPLISPAATYSNDKHETQQTRILIIRLFLMEWAAS